MMGRMCRLALGVMLALAVFGSLAAAQSVTVGDEAAGGPAAWFTFTPSSPKPGQTIQLDATLSEGEGGIVSYQWDTSGDGFADRAGAKISLTYGQAGTYPVTLTVHDRLGRIAKVTRTIHVAQTGGEVHVSVTSEPPEMTVYVDGKNMGQTPLELSVTPGIHRLRLRHYWLGEWETELDVRKLRALELHVVLD